MGRDDLIYNHARSLSSFWFTETIFIWLGAPRSLFLGIMTNFYLCYTVFITTDDVTNVFL